MERMGIVRICKEAAQLLHQHYRFFLPFIVFFFLPASLMSVLSNTFLVPFLVPAYIAGQGETLTSDTYNVVPASILLSQVFLTPKFMFSTFGVVWVTCIVKCIYSDDAVTWDRVLKRLPISRYSNVRLAVTRFWESVAALLLAVPCYLLAFLVHGGADPKPAVVYVVFVSSHAAGTAALALRFALAQFVVVLEQENYGLKALQQSSRYARGRLGTVFGVVALGALLDALVYFLHARAVAAAELWVEIVAMIAISVVYAFLSAYVALVGAVMYFVCKSGSDAAAAQLPVAAAESPYRPVASESTIDRAS